MKATLIWNFDESIISILPEGEVPYSGFEDQASSNGTLSTKILKKFVECMKPIHSQWVRVIRTDIPQFVESLKTSITLLRVVMIV